MPKPRTPGYKRAKEKLNKLGPRGNPKKQQELRQQIRREKAKARRRSSLNI